MRTVGGVDWAVDVSHRRGMRVLVTGGAGFIGSHIVDALVEQGHQPAVLDDLSSGHRRNLREGVPFHEVDLRDRDAVHGVLESFRPTVVCHQAAQTSVAVSAREPVLDASVNVVGSLHLLDACVAHGVERVLFASTGGAIYGEVEAPARAQLDWVPRPLSPYACSKLALERYLDFYRHEHGLQSTVLRYANVYGPRQDPHGEAGVVAIFAKRLLVGSPIQINAMREEGDAGCIRDYVFVADVVRANLAALAGELTGTVHVATGIETRTKDIADALIESLGVECTPGVGPRRPGDLERSVLEPEPRLGAMVGLSDGLARTAKWFADASA